MDGNGHVHSMLHAMQHAMAGPHHFAFCLQQGQLHVYVRSMHLLCECSNSLTGAGPQGGPQVAAQGHSAP